MREAHFGIKSLVFGSEVVKKGLDIFSNINGAIEDLNRAEEPRLSGIATAEDLGLVRGKGEIRTEVGQVYGRLVREIRLVQVNESDLNTSMGKLAVESISSNVDFSKLEIKWRRKYGENFIDIPNLEQNSRVYALTADDIGTTLIVEIKPRVETEDKLNITYGELGPICISESTKKSLLNSIRSGIARFPVKLLRNEYDILLDSKNKNNDDHLDDFNSRELTRDLLVVTTEDVKILRDGISCSFGLNAEKRTEWSAKYFGGNIQVILDTKNPNEFTLISGNELHKQTIRLRATSKNSRDMLTLIIRCLNAKHLISIEAILKCTLWSSMLNTKFSTCGDKNKNINFGNQIDDDAKLDVLSYTAKLEEDIVELLHKEKKNVDEKNKLKNEKTVLENELSETISAYQGIISQINLQDKEKIDSFQANGNSISGSKKGENKVSNKGKSLLYGYSDGIYILNNSKGISSLESNKSIPNENQKLPSSLDNVNTKRIKDMESELLELRERLDNSTKEKAVLVDQVDKSRLEIENMKNELELYKKYDLNDCKNEIKKISEYKNRILELESQNSEKQEAIQNIVSEKSKLSKDLSNIKFDFNRLKDQHNQLNKKYVSLTINNNCSDESYLKDEIKSLKQKVSDLENINSELNATVSNLKYRVRRLAMIKY
ncbi:hypothetical protein FG386_000600 [Cryptosporidium ryanae]|uniref:uncharacterized protein n=1 Tax=Cryptosporidium ryanae TaxID=515981 RepID=UPI00351A5922|nr:hypothetical protein FG386_000600 [Cryptosporidium ryanae]